MKYTNWKLSSCSPSSLNELLEAGVSPLVAAVLCSRGIATWVEAKEFLSADLSRLHEPDGLLDMNQAVQRIRTALRKEEKIAVYGDYDVDGITSTALLTSFLRSRGARVLPYIPDRLEEGYGLNPQAVQKLRRQGVSLIITVDCGITAVEEVALAASLGMDVVITDHHECKEILPAAVAVVNPHRPGCPYPFKGLAGVGVALKLALALTPPEERRQVLTTYVDLAAIGTVADVMELTDENRTIVALGLMVLQRPRRLGLQMLLREAGVEGKPPTATTIGFSLAPRINASGRMGCADLACELLLTRDYARAEELARDLCALNRERQAIEMEIYQECLTRLARNVPEDTFSVVLADWRWHQGVVGIVASRLSERFSCPTFMICLSEGKGKGSCRSYGGVNLFQALEHCSDLLESFGGHELAAGFTILEQNIPLFRQRIDAYIRSSVQNCPLTADLAVDVNLPDANALTLENILALDLLEPTGAGNPKPVFQLCGATVVSVSTVGNGRHTKFRVKRGGVGLDAIFFGANPQEAELAVGSKVDLAFTASINEYRGSRSVQLMIVDVRPALTLVQAEQQLYLRYRAGERLTLQEVSLLTPEREDFVAVWRYLSAQAGASLIEDTGPRLSRKIARTFGLRESYLRTMVCLDVLDERGLIALHTNTDHLQIHILPARGKVNLEDSHIMKHLRSLLR